MSQSSLNPCSVPNQFNSITDPPSSVCADTCGDESIRNTPSTDTGNFPDCSLKDGVHGLCDPIQTGQIINDIDRPNRDVIYRYGKGLRSCDEAMLDLFNNIVVLDDEGKVHKVPVIWATQERAVAAILQENVRQDSDVVDRIKLPIMAISANGYNFNQDRYIYHQALSYVKNFNPALKSRIASDNKEGYGTVFGLTRGIPVDVSYSLYVWTMFVEDMNQIFEQIIPKFSPLAYIRVRGVRWEIGVKLDSIANNIDVEPGDQNLRVVKFEFNMTAETFIPQPIVRKKAVLRTRMDILDGLTEDDTIEVISKIEEAVKEKQ